MTTSDDSKFVAAFVTNIILACVFLILFTICRHYFPKIYQYRCNNSVNPPSAPPRTPLGWLFSTIKYSDDELYKTHGMDAVMFIKFIKMMLTMICIMSIYGFVVLFAVNATGENTKIESTNDLYTAGLNSLTMAAVGIKSDRLVAHLFSVIFNSFVVFYFTYNMFKTYMRLRFQWKTNDERIENFSVMVRGVPLNLSDKNLDDFFNRLFPGKVISVIRAYSTPSLDTNIEKRNAELYAVERFQALYEKKGERPIDKDKFLIGNKVDAIEWHTKRFNHYTEKIDSMQKKAYPRGNVVFVVFNDMVAAAQCSQVLLDAQSSMVCEQAPEPRDLIWPHFNIAHYEFLIRKLVINVFFFFLIFFWAIPVTFVSSLSNLDTLSKVKGFDFLVDFIKLNSVITGFVQGFLPTLALTIFFAILLKIITFAVTQSGVYTHSKVSRATTTKYYAFQIVNVLLVYTISGSILKVLDDIGGDVNKVVDLLATSLPKQSGFFINYVMLLSLSGHTKDLWNPGFLIVSHIKRRFLCKSYRDFRTAERPDPFPYAQYYTNHLLVFTILITYSTLAPFIMAFGIVYFCLALLSNKYNILYVCPTNFEGGGQHWIDVYHRIITGTILYQIVLIGVFGAYQFFAGAVVAIIMLVITLVFNWYTRQQFLRSVKNTPMMSFNLLEQMDSINNNESRINVKGAAPHKEKVEITNVNADLYFYQPSLVPVTDEPEPQGGKVSVPLSPKSSKVPRDKLKEEEMEVIVKSDGATPTQEEAEKEEIEAHTI